MKLLRYGLLGEEKPGMVDEQGHLRDLSAYVHDFTPQTLSDTTLLHQLQTLRPQELPLVNQEVRIGACIGMPGKIVCVGYNSNLHTQQMGMPLPQGSHMMVFMKPTSAVCGPFDPILYTRHTKKLDWEAELGVVIGKRGKYITKEQAGEHILGYVCINDLSERYLQLEAGDTQYTKGKCFDNAAPIGPYLVTKDEIQDANDLEVTLSVNGEIRQAFSTSDYIHNDKEVISYLSQYFTLHPGDIISMGSGPGNAKAWGNQFLKPNDKVVFSIVGLGQQEHTVVLEDELPPR